MKVMLVQPNYHAGGAEIAGNWPPSWVAYIGGALKAAGFSNLRFVDAMTNDLSDETVRQIIEKNQPDVVLATAITPMIYKAEATLKIAKEVNPKVRAILGGIHPTFMYAQVLAEAERQTRKLEAELRKLDSEWPLATPRTAEPTEKPDGEEAAGDNVILLPHRARDAKTGTPSSS